MGDRSGRTTQRLDSLELIALARKSIVGDATEVPLDAISEDDDPFADWAEPVVAEGSQPEALPTSSRTTTLLDPLTTGLLAEVARRAQTVELDPSTVEVARRSTREIDPAELADALRDSEHTHPVHVHTRRK